MGKRFGILAAAAVALAVVGTTQAGGGNDFFNRKDLTGWDGNSELWSVKDGAIVGNTGEKGIKGNTFLISKRPYKDFELSCDVQLKNGAGNSGIQIRSKVVDEKKWVVHGPQADMAKGYWGSLYGEGKGMMKAAPKDVVAKAVPKDGEFVAYYIKCVGKHVTIKLNGMTTIDDDFNDMPDEGIIAFQLHQGGPMEVTFKNIQFTDLSKK
jgi:hypothetical protein